jgi:hypothetical protein
MKKLACILIGGLMMLGVSTTSAPAAGIGLFDYAFNLDNSVVQTDSSINTSAFNTTSGLGTITITIAGIGNHSVLGFFDHEIDEVVNTFFNEYGSASGTAAAGQSWEIDEPGYVFGDIYDNLLAGALDNTNAVPVGSPNDVSMAMGWFFSLAADQTAVITFLLSDTMPTSGFYLAHLDPLDPDSPAGLYFNSNIDIRSTGAPVPEPMSMLLFGSGIVACAGWIRRKSQG